MKYCCWRLKQRFLASLTQSSVASAGSGQRRGIKLLAGLGWAGLSWAGLGWAGKEWAVSQGHTPAPTIIYADVVAINCLQNIAASTN